MLHFAGEVSLLFALASCLYVDWCLCFWHSQLTNECLSATTASCPMIESLILMSCSSIGLDGLCSLQRLPNLTLLDLSYTFLVNLQPVFESCTQLKVRVAIYFRACNFSCIWFVRSVVIVEWHHNAHAKGKDGQFYKHLMKMQCRVCACVLCPGMFMNWLVGLIVLFLKCESIFIYKTILWL